MNPNFTRYQKRPSLDALLASANLAETCGQTELQMQMHVKALHSLFPLPEGAGQGKGKPTVKPTLAKPANSLRT